MILSMAAFGIVAGFVPSPHTLAISQASSLRVRAWGCIQGVFADLILIMISLLLFVSFNLSQSLSDSIVRLGGLYFCVFAILKLFGKRSKIAGRAMSPFITQLMNLNPIIFWASVGAPLVLSGIQNEKLSLSLLSVGVFLAEVYVIKFLYLGALSHFKVPGFNKVLIWLTFTYGVYLNLFGFSGFN